MFPVQLQLLCVLQLLDTAALLFLDDISSGVFVHRTKVNQHIVSARE